MGKARRYKARRCIGANSKATVKSSSTLELVGPVTKTSNSGRLPGLLTKFRWFRATIRMSRSVDDKTGDRELGRSAAPNIRSPIVGERSQICCACLGCFQSQKLLHNCIDRSRLDSHDKGNGLNRATGPLARAYAGSFTIVRLQS